MPSVTGDPVSVVQAARTVSKNSDLQQKLPRLVPRKKQPSAQDPPPAPETPPLPPSPDLSTVRFSEPVRRILSPRDHDLFLNSPTYNLVLSFVFSLSDSVVDRTPSSSPLDDPSAAPPIIHILLSVLSSIASLIESNPPTSQDHSASPTNSRFGNPAFRDFYDAVCFSLPQYLSLLPLPPPVTSSALEPSTYLLHSFGSRARIDYGSGHELNFLLFLLCLNRLSLLPVSAFPSLTLHVFPRYITLLRSIQSTYYLEPAGSHGVWGLDDYQFLPFLFGASQLLHHPYIRPLSIHNELVLEEEADKYLYLDMVRYTMSTKSVKGLKWTQPMLDDISGAKNWEKVEGGMRRMFMKEVLGKLPVMQHFLFGGLIPAVEGMGRESTEGEGMLEMKEAPGHLHNDNQWGECCGIKVPSTIAAAQEAKKQGGGEGLRRIPFD